MRWWDAVDLEIDSLTIGFAGDEPVLNRKMCQAELSAVHLNDWIERIVVGC